MFKLINTYLTLHNERYIVFTAYLNIPAKINIKFASNII